MANPKQDEPVYYFEWDAGEGKHILYDANIRVLLNSPNMKRPKVHLTVLRQDETLDNINNVEEVEFQDTTGVSYWRKRFQTWPVP
jgi:hypothetical protein